MKEVKPSKKPLAIYYAIVLLVLLVLSALLILCDGIVCRTTRGMTHLIGKQEVVK